MKNGRMAENDSVLRVDEFMNRNGIDCFYGHWPEDDSYLAGNRLPRGTSEKEEIASLIGFATYKHRTYQETGVSGE